MNSAFDISRTPAWRALSAHSERLSSVRIKDLFIADSERFARYSKSNQLLLFDFSKNKFNDETMDLLFSLANAVNLRERSRELLSADPVSCHVATRDDRSQPLGKPSPEIAEVKSRMRTISEAVRSGDKTGHSGKRIRHVVNLGIGGSCLGPVMVSRALAHLGHPDISFYHVSNIDQTQADSVLAKIEPESSLFIVVSKSFATRETLINLRRVRSWLSSHYGDKTAWLDHVVAVTSRPDRAIKRGLSAEQCIMLPQRLGGRYSLWSATGLMPAICIGMDQFEQLLAGAHLADRHFFGEDVANNIPILHALLSVWNINFQNIRSHVILPYNYVLSSLVLHLQQLEMESNGKSVDRFGQALNYQTALVIWGGSAIDAQHTFYQMLQQGMMTVSSDFIMAIRAHRGRENDHLLFSDYIAQSHSLMWGHQHKDPHKVHGGNQPSNSVLLAELSPAALGMLLAFYEHKVYAQSLVWQINPFDQWGVELAKHISRDVLPVIGEKKKTAGQTMELDSSSRGLIRRYLDDNRQSD